jgi:hypothetical protein
MQLTFQLVDWLGNGGIRVDIIMSILYYFRERRDMDERVVKLETGCVSRELQRFETRVMS